MVLGQMYQWKPGQEIDVKLERDGNPIEIKTTLKQSYTTSETLMEDENANELQINLRKAWLKG